MAEGGGMGGGLPAAPRDIPGFPENADLFPFEDFRTLDTKPSRAGIDDRDMAWCMNFMPLGKRNLQALYDVGDAIYTAATGKTITGFAFVNVAASPLSVIFLSDGSGVLVNTEALDVTAFMPAGTINSSVPPAVAQYGAGTYLLIVSDQLNGYFIWNGHTLSKPGGVAPDIVVTDGGSGYTTAPTVSFSGGSGSGATATASVANGSVIDITLTSAGSGWLVGETVTVGFSGGGGSGATADATLVPFGISGTAIEIYSAIVWVANGGVVTFSAPGSISDFSTSSGGGAFPSSDPFLRVKRVQLKQANSFLYLVNDSSINYVSGVSTSGSPPTTTFTNQNIDPQIGSPWRDSVQVYSRTIAMANSFGIFGLAGGATEKVSTPLDGIFRSAPLGQLGSFTPSSAVATLFGIQSYMLLLPILDQITRLFVNALLMWDGQRWWTAQPSVTLKQIACQEINSVLRAWGHDGASVYPLFDTPSTAITKTVRSKLWDRPSMITWKRPMTVYAAWQTSLPDPIADLTITVDSEGNPATLGQTTFVPGQYPVTLLSRANITWSNASGLEVIWENASHQEVDFVVGALQTNWEGSIGGDAGQFQGLTITSTAEDFALVTITLLDQNSHEIVGV